MLSGEPYLNLCPLSYGLPSFLASLACPASNLASSKDYSVRLPVYRDQLNVIGYKPILYFES